MIAASGYEPVFIMIAFLHIISAALLTVFVPQIRQLVSD